MKFFSTLLLAFALVSGAFAQTCTPDTAGIQLDPQYNNVAGFNPSPVPAAEVGVAYDQVIQFKAAAEVPNDLPLVGGQTIKSVEVKDLKGLPDGLEWLAVSANPADAGNSGADGLTFTSLDPDNNAGPAGCIRIYGTPTTAAGYEQPKLDSIRLALDVTTESTTISDGLLASQAPIDLYLHVTCTTGKKTEPETTAPL